MINEKKKRKILVVEPHPDDAAIMAGGTIAKLVHDGNELSFLTITDGERGCLDRNIKTEEDLRSVVRKEAKNATNILGVASDTFLAYPNHDVTPDLERELRRVVTEHVRRFQPDVVMTYDPYLTYEPNPDHRTVALATYDAVTFSQNHLDYPEQISKGLEPHLVGEIWFFNSPSPNHIEDVTELFAQKVHAISAYRSAVTSMIEEVKRRLILAGYDASFIDNTPYEELVSQIFVNPPESGRYLEKFKVIRPFISERVPHLIAMGVVKASLSQ